MNETDGTKLLCHRIPISILGEKLLEVIPGDFTIEVKVKKNFLMQSFIITTKIYSYRRGVNIMRKLKFFVYRDY